MDPTLGAASSDLRKPALAFFASLHDESCYCDNGLSLGAWPQLRSFS